VPLAPAVLAEIENRQLPLPVVVIDDEVKFSRYIDYWSIAEIIEKLRQEDVSTSA